MWAGREASALAGVVVVVVAAVLVVVARREPHPAGATTAPVLAYLLLGAYVLPWYAVWVLPALVATARRRLGLVVVVLAAVFQLAELPGRRGPGGAPASVSPWLHHLQSGALYVAVPLMEGAVALALLALGVAGMRARAGAPVEADAAPLGPVLSEVSRP